MKSFLREIIKENGLKQKHVAEKAGISERHFSHIVRGESVPTLENGIRIAKALNKTVEEIWEVE